MRRRRLVLGEGGEPVVRVREPGAESVKEGLDVGSPVLAPDVQGLKLGQGRGGGDVGVLEQDLKRFA